MLTKTRRFHSPTGWRAGSRKTRRQKTHRTAPCARGEPNGVVSYEALPHGASGAPAPRKGVIANTVRAPCPRRRAILETKQPTTKKKGRPMDKIVIEIPECTRITEPVLQNMYKDAVERIANHLVTSVADEVASIVGGLEEAVAIAVNGITNGLNGGAK